MSSSLPRSGFSRRARRSALVALLASGFTTLALGDASAETYQVGAGLPFATIQEALGSVAPGDVIEVQGDATYPGDLWFRPESGGDPGNPVTVRGIPVNGRRPIIEGVGTEKYHDIIVLFQANHFVFEGFEIIGDKDPAHFGLVHKADDVTIRDVVVHGVGSHGLLGTDDESGSLLLERSEFYDNGEGTYNHQVYMATDETIHPGSVFRMQNCYVHDAAGGNSVKSRAERNEIYSNWIEGGIFHELDLIGPDGQDESLAREDSDVVGNVLVKHSEWRIARIGGDGTGNTAGRYRFVNNTMVLSAESQTAITMQETVASLEMHNNVIVRIGGQGGALVVETDMFGPPPTFSGSSNWAEQGFDEIPPGVGMVIGPEPQWMDIDQLDFRPQEFSPLVNAGTSATTTSDFPNPLLAPAFVPPSRLLGTHGTRPSDAAIDIGAYEFGSGTEPGEPVATVGVGPGSSGVGSDSSGSSAQGSGGAGHGAGGADGNGNGNGNGAGNGAGGAGGGDAAADGALRGSCACRAAGGPSSSTAGLAFVAAVAIAGLRRRVRVDAVVR